MTLSKSSLASVMLSIALGFGALVAQAQEAAKPADAASTGKKRFGSVDMQAVIITVEEGKAAREGLKKKIETKQKELEKQKGELDKMNEDWKKQAALLSEEARMKKQQEFQEKFLGLRNEEMNFQAEIQREEQKATQAIFEKVAVLVERVAKEKNLEAVFERSTSGVLYLDSPVDLTKEVIQRYGKETKPTAKK